MARLRAPGEGLRVLLPALLTLPVVALLGIGVARATVPPVEAAPPATADVFGAGAQHATLPAGVRLDEKGLLTGVSLVTEPGTTLLAWETLLAHAIGAEGLGTLPSEILALEGRRVTVVGFMLPLYETEGVRRFALVGSPWSCHFGVPAGLEGTLDVTLEAGQEALESTWEPLRVVGTFRARETREARWLVSVYALDDARVTPLR